MTTGGKEVWVRVDPEIFSAPTQSYKLSIVEVAALKQVVTANKLLEELDKNGFIALYINFDTGKWDLKADGQATVREIAAALKSAPALKIAIEGHTDNVGQAAANKTLSQRRAQSVMAAIVAGGVDAGRLSAAGFGQERPVADNRGEEGRSKNRRVELVKR
ncbi:MAG: OmpA family protein [Betaproteobacteria bacterium]|nr:OmpA family protein [Betaproteobacteria bacterium]